MVRIAVDVMGGDHAPDAILQGCGEALGRSPALALLLVGPEAELRDRATQAGLDLTRVEFLNAQEVIGNSEHPVTAVRRKKDSSIVRAMNAVVAGQAQGFVSAGSTGAVLAGATFIIKRIPGISRPALAPVLPTQAGGGALLIDCGANVDCKPEYLQQFALMGEAYMSRVMGVAQPRSGIINNGAEDEKGNDLVKKSSALIRQDPRIHFVGSVEARDVLSGQAEVLVCDGFVGNMVLKSIEGTAKFMMKELKGVLYKSLPNKLAALTLKKDMLSFKQKLDYKEYGGAPLLGVTAPVVKAHGSSNGHAFAQALLQCQQMVEGNLVQEIEKGLQPQGE